MDEFVEEWKPVVGYEGRYAISNLGRVKSFLNTRGRPRIAPLILKPRRHTGGYVRVQLGDGNDRYIHALVMEAFVGPYPPGMEVNHVDGVKVNNRLANLEYATHPENNLHAYRLGLKDPATCASPGSRNGRAKLDETDISAVREMGATHTCAEVAARFGLSPAAAHRIIARKSWRHVA